MMEETGGKKAERQICDENAFSIELIKSFIKVFNTQEEK